MRNIIPILCVLIILLFIGSCSTPGISVATIRVKHKKQSTPELTEKPLVVIADTGFFLPLPITNRDSFFTPALKEDKNLSRTITQKPEYKKVKPQEINKANQFNIITRRNNPHDEIKIDDKRKYHRMAVLSLIFGIAGILLLPPLSIVAIVLGVKSMNHNEPLSTAGFILGIIGLTLMLLFLIIILIVVSLSSLSQVFFLFLILAAV